MRVRWCVQQAPASKLAGARTRIGQYVDSLKAESKREGAGDWNQFFSGQQFRAVNKGSIEIAGSFMHGPGAEAGFIYSSLLISTHI